MEFTDTLNLPCPDSTDYALLPIYMQDLAEQIEAKIVAQRARITAVDTQPVAVFRNFSTSGPNSANSFTSFMDFGDVVFRNYSIPGRFGGVPDFTFSPGQTFPRSGIYLVGYLLNLSNTGAVGDLTKRKAYFRVIRTSTSGTVTVLADLTTEVLANNTTNGEGFGNVGVVAISDQDLSQVGILVGWVHNDATSSVSIGAGAFVTYLQRIGSTDLIEVT